MAALALTENPMKLIRTNKVGKGQFRRVGSYVIELTCDERSMVEKALEFYTLGTESFDDAIFSGALAQIISTYSIQKDRLAKPNYTIWGPRDYYWNEEDK